MSALNVFIATPTYGPKPPGDYSGPPDYRGIDGQTAVSIERARAIIAHRGGASSFTRLFGAIIDRARAELVGVFLDSGASHLLWWDADIAASHKAIASMLDVERPMTACLYRSRHVGSARAFHWIDPKGRGVEGLEVEAIKGHRVARMPGPTTMGFSLMSRAAVQAVHDAHPELECRSRVREGKVIRALFQPMFVSAIEGGAPDKTDEDYAFVFRANAIGLYVDALIDAEVEHAGLVGRFGDQLP